ncbi:hypothetical protein WL58_28710 [Burkholderia cepacia]|nr:hypothetical protein WL58_28710 [Burkholderia cepacia]
MREYLTPHEIVAIWPVTILFIIKVARRNLILLSPLALSPCHFELILREWFADGTFKKSDQIF